MTKLLILSDSHGGSDAIARILKAERENIDALIFLGDGLRDLELALTKYPRLRTYAVAGNCDFGALEPYDGLAAFDQVIVFYTHGHMYGVKYDLDTLADAAAARGAQVALFGHTHIPLAETRGRVFLFNPGSCGRCYTGADTYGILTLADGKVVGHEHKEVPKSMSINEVRYLPECGSTNAYVKEHFEEFGPVGAVYTTNQTAGRGRLGRTWVNAEGKALYYTVAIREPLAQPATLPLLASLAVRRQLSLRYGVECQIKWPNDLLLNGKKIVGILCEGVSYGYQQQGRGILCGIGINLAQPQSYFDAADLPHGTSLALQGANVDLTTDPEWLAEALTDFGFDRPMYVFARDGFAPFREEYKKACVNIGRRVTFDLPGGGEGSGEAVDIDEEGRLVVRTDSGEEHVFTGEVSVHGIYGAV